ncbi:MAG: alpha/beta fold hydrolase [Chloroflexota bacterium]|nr:alpha/beta fold hydrolase [Chloroflexota bacterium]
MALLAGALIVATYIIVTTARLAKDTLTPPRTPVDRTPLDVGIKEWEDVTFTTRDGITLRGWHIPPENDATIILAHGYAANRQMLLTEAQVLVEQGYGVLLFDFRGHGESEGNLVTIGDHEQRDLSAAVDFVAAQPNIVKIGAIGFSMGAATLAQVAAQDDRLSAIVIEAAFPTLAEEIHHRSRAFGPLSQIPALRAIRRSGVDVDGVRPIDDLCRISPRPVLLIYGELDTDVPPGTAQAMFDAACEPAELWVVAGATHQNYAEVAPEEYTARLLRFFDW